jgi:lysozyme
MDQPRKGVFDAITAEREGRRFTTPEVQEVDALLDRLGVPRAGAAPIGAGAQRASSAAIELIKRYEGLRLSAYKCPAGIWTIGYGATGAGIGPGLVWTQEQADRRLLEDVRAFEEAVRFLLAGKRATQGQFDAMVSFAYNCGSDIDNDHTPEGLGDSGLLRLHLAGDYAGAAAEFGKWVNGGGRKLEGLVRRRKDEAALYRAAA